MDKIMDVIGRFWKAVVGFAVPAAVIITSAVQKGSDGGESITTAEWVTAACAAIITAGGVAVTRNRSKTGE